MTEAVMMDLIDLAYLAGRADSVSRRQELDSLLRDTDTTVKEKD